MSRRKVKGLTRTGRQVSEDPDLDNLLSTLSPAEMEELEKDMMKVPDLNPEDGKVIVQADNLSNNVEDAKVRSDLKGRLSKREQSLEVCESFHGFDFRRSAFVSNGKLFRLAVTQANQINGPFSLMEHHIM